MISWGLVVIVLFAVAIVLAVGFELLLGRFELIQRNADPEGEPDER